MDYPILLSSVSLSCPAHPISATASASVRRLSNERAPFIAAHDRPAAAPELVPTLGDSGVSEAAFPATTSLMAGQKIGHTKGLPMHLLNEPLLEGIREFAHHPRTTKDCVVLLVPPSPVAGLCAVQIAAPRPSRAAGSPNRT